MTITELEPETSGAAPGPGRLKHAGTDDRCEWEEWSSLHLRMVRCHKTATDTVNGKLFCSPHADQAAGI